MSTNSLLSCERKALTLKDGKGSEVQPQFQAAILFLIYFAQGAADISDCQSSFDSKSSPHYHARTILQHFYDVDIPARNIERYCNTVKCHIGWHEYAVADVIFQLLPDNQEAFDEITNFFPSTRLVSSDSSFSWIFVRVRWQLLKQWVSLMPDTRAFLREVARATIDHVDGRMVACARIRAYWMGASRFNKSRYPSVNDLKSWRNLKRG